MSVAAFTVLIFLSGCGFEPDLREVVNTTVDAPGCRCGALLMPLSQGLPQRLICGHSGSQQPRPETTVPHASQTPMPFTEILMSTESTAGRVAVITGASSGIGEATARTLAA